MKKTLNLIALLCMVGFAGSWECGLCSFREMLMNMGTALSFIFVLHLLLKLPRLFNVKRRKIKRVKIY